MNLERSSGPLLATPLAFAVLTLFHPFVHPADMDGTGRWLTVHVLQLVLLVPLAQCVWSLLRGLPGRAATVARHALPVFLVAFAAFDAVCGIATGLLARAAEGEDAATQAGFDRAIRELFDDNWLIGADSAVAYVGSLAWIAVAVGGALALRRAGADRWTVRLMAASVLLAIGHPAPFGTLALLALWGAAVRWNGTKAPAAAQTAPAMARADTPVSQ